jgi:hypothetical protein
MRCSTSCGSWKSSLVVLLVVPLLLVVALDGDTPPSAEHSFSSTSSPVSLQHVRFLETHVPSLLPSSGKQQPSEESYGEIELPFYNREGKGSLTKVPVTLATRAPPRPPSGSSSSVVDVCVTGHTRLVAQSLHYWSLYVRAVAEEHQPQQQQQLSWRLFVATGGRARLEPPPLIQAPVVHKKPHGNHHHKKEESAEEAENNNNNAHDEIPEEISDTDRLVRSMQQLHASHAHSVELTRFVHFGSVEWPVEQSGSRYPLCGALLAHAAPLTSPEPTHHFVLIVRGSQWWIHPLLLLAPPRPPSSSRAADWTIRLLGAGSEHDRYSVLQNQVGEQPIHFLIENEVIVKPDMLVFDAAGTWPLDHWRVGVGAVAGPSLTVLRWISLMWQRPLASSLCQTDLCWATRNADLLTEKKLPYAVMDFGLEANLQQTAWSEDCIGKASCKAGEWLNDKASRDFVFRVPPQLRCVNYRLYRLEEMGTQLFDQKTSVAGHLGRLVMDDSEPVDWSQCHGPNIPLGSVQMCEPQYMRQMEWVYTAGSPLQRRPRPQQHIVALLRESGVCIRGGATRLSVRRVYATAASDPDGAEGKEGADVGVHAPLDREGARDHPKYDGLALASEFLVGPRSGGASNVVEGFWRKTPDEDTRRPQHSLIPVRLKRPGR